MVSERGAGVLFHKGAGGGCGFGALQCFRFGSIMTLLQQQHKQSKQISGFFSPTPPDAPYLVFFIIPYVIDPFDEIHYCEYHDYHHRQNVRRARARESGPWPSTNSCFQASQPEHEVPTAQDTGSSISKDSIEGSASRRECTDRIWWEVR